MTTLTQTPCKLFLVSSKSGVCVTVRNYDRLQEARRDGSRWATAWQAATVTGGRDKNKGQGQCSGYKAHTVLGTETRFSGRKQVYFFFMRGPSQRCIRPILNTSKLTAKEKNPPRASHQFLWSGTNSTCSIKHESFPLRRRQDATRVHKNIGKEKLGEEDSSSKAKLLSPRSWGTIGRSQMWCW